MSANAVSVGASLPWHDSQWATVRAALGADRFPHALMLAGPIGMGKRRFAQELAATLLCKESAGGFACGVCRSCELHAAGTHPDYRYMTLEEDDRGKMRTRVVIDQVRRLNEFLYLTAGFSKYKVVVIEPADAMNNNAQNALLKVLEEPPGRVAIILVSDQPSLLNATIRSRCQIMSFHHADEAIAAQWLATQQISDRPASLLLDISRGAPLHALQIAKEALLEQRDQLLADLQQLRSGKADPLVIAAGWLKAWDTGKTLELLHMLTTDLVRCLSGAEPDQLINRDLVKPLQVLAKELDLFILFRVLEGTSAAWRMSGSGSSVKDDNILADIAIQWVWAGA